MAADTLRELSGWGRFRPGRCQVSAPGTRSALVAAVTDDDAGHGIARGLGRSYGDPAVDEGGGVLMQTGLDRLLAFDQESGVVTCEGGVTLARLIEVFLPRGWFLPTTPGTKFVTIGGAIAADVHGKNHHVDGSFGAHVDALELLLASGEIVTCGPQDRVGLFWATVGGMGLTGIILSARIRLIPVRSGWFRLDRERIPDIDAVLARLKEDGGTHRYSVGWIDCLASGRHLGRTVLMLGDHAEPEELAPHHRARPLSPPRRREKSFPINAPGFALNRWSVGAFNQAYWWSQSPGRHLVDYDRFFYPLDAVRGWNRVYGKRGFVQYQVLFSDDQAAAGLRAVLEAVSAAGQASFLAVIKRSGAANPSPLSYLHEGVTLALDLPNAGESLLELVRRLDRIVLDRGGRLYLAKDALMDAATFRAMYPRREEFLALKAVVDPRNRFQSSQARRVGLVP